MNWKQVELTCLTVGGVCVASTTAATHTSAVGGAADARPITAVTDASTGGAPVVNLTTCNVQNNVKYYFIQKSKNGIK